MVKDGVIAVALLVFSIGMTFVVGYFLQFETMWWFGPVFIWSTAVAIAALVAACFLFATAKKDEDAA